MACSPLLSEEDLYRFRTKQCLRLAKGMCKFGVDRCQYSHNAEWIRRSPYYISLPSYLRYIPVSCPFFIKNVNNNNNEQDKEKKNTIIKNSVFLTNKDGSVNNNFYKYIEETNIHKCPLGVECPLAHSKDEIEYHPLVYKTKRCENYKHANCNRYYCPNLHGLAEQRKIKQYFIPFSNKIHIPHYPNVTIVNKIQYGSFKGQNQINSTDKKDIIIRPFNSCSYDFHFMHVSERESNIDESMKYGVNSSIMENIKHNMLKSSTNNNKGQVNSYNTSDSYNRKEEYRIVPKCGGKDRKIKDFKSNSINVPCDEKNIVKTRGTSYSTGYPIWCSYILKNNGNSFSKKKKKNSIFSYLNNYDDDKSKLYLHILNKFPYLFNLNVTDINSNSSYLGPVNTTKLTNRSVLDDNTTSVLYAKDNARAMFDPVIIDGDAPGTTPSSAAGCSRENIFSKFSAKADGVTDADRREEIQYEMFEEKTKHLFLNNTHYDIINHILKKNLEITRNKIKHEHNSSSALIDLDNSQKNCSNDLVNLEFIKRCTSQKGNTDEIQIESYDSFLNLLSYVLCLLYFTTNSRAHSSFDLYAQQLAKHETFCRKFYSKVYTC
ncbi:zinc finger protein, putative [Plasmodium malariae]|uniref:Zinc finger protein, putative n=1 Tax=Plasmodium malariae TaxID=5858 RepID=A0A1C3KLW9_PLAMA|nr:zinc finger protein, putative [Plasmodium malariae]